MTDMNKITDTTTADQPPAPNGHGTGNGVSNGEPKVDAATQEGATDTTSSAKKKTKAERRAEKKAAAAATSATSATAASTETTTAATETATTAPAAAVAPEVPAVAPEVPAAAPSVEAIAAPIETPVERLRIRMKIWMHPQTTKRYLMSNAYMRDVVNGQPVTDVMVAYATRDDETMVVTLTASQWQALPFFYMQEDGPAPRPTRP